jgi:hypothetical protein
MHIAQLFWPVILEDVAMINPSTKRRLFRHVKKPIVDTDAPPRKHVPSVTGRVILGKLSRQCHESNSSVTPAMAAISSPVLTS